MAVTISVSVLSAAPLQSQLSGLVYTRALAKDRGTSISVFWQGAALLIAATALNIWMW